MITSFTTGLMGAGKSKELIEKFFNDTSEKLALAAHLTEETGTHGTIESRNGNKIAAIYLNKDDEDHIILLMVELILVNDIETIYIDEVQFLSQDIVEQMISVAEDFDVTIHFYGLSTTFTGDYFESAEYLLEKADHTHQIHRLCENDDCNFVARFNARIVNGRVTREGDTFVSEKNKYLSLCSICYFS